MRQHKIPLGWFLGLTLATVVISLPWGPPWESMFGMSRWKVLIWRSPPAITHLLRTTIFQIFSTIP